MVETILALNGVHTAGKSTLGEMLEAREGLNYFPEIAQRLINEEGSDWGEEGTHDFQEAIHVNEAARDRELLTDNIDHAVIETWHPGCLAHSMENAEQDLVDEQEEYLEIFDEHSGVDIYAVFLNMPLENIWERSPHFEEGDDDVINFYDEVRDNHFQIYEKHGIEYIEVENDGDFEEAYETVRDFAYEVLEQ